VLENDIRSADGVVPIFARDRKDQSIGMGALLINRDGDRANVSVKMAGSDNPVLMKATEGDRFTELINEALVLSLDLVLLAQAIG